MSKGFCSVSSRLLDFQASIIDKIWQGVRDWFLSWAGRVVNRVRSGINDSVSVGIDRDRCGGVGDWFGDWVEDWFGDSVGDWFRDSCGDWFRDSVVDWFIDWVADWVGDWFRDSVVDWFIDWVGDWFRDWFRDWVVDWFIDWVGDWFRDWFRDWVGDSPFLFTASFALLGGHHHPLFLCLCEHLFLRRYRTNKATIIIATITPMLPETTSTITTKNNNYLECIGGIFCG